MRYALRGATWFIVGAATGGLGFGQVVTKETNSFGLEIESVSLDTAAFKAKVVVHNSSGRPITAYVVDLAPVYSDGEELSAESYVDFFASLGSKHLFPLGPGSDPNIDAITSGTSRQSTFLYGKANDTSAQFLGIRARVTGVIFEDESTAGESKWIGVIAGIRDAKSAEVIRWCEDVKKFSGGGVSRKTVSDILVAHASAPTPEGRPVAGQGAATVEREELLNIFRQGIVWHNDDTATLLTLASQYFEASCANAKSHQERRRGAQ